MGGGGNCGASRCRVCYQRNLTNLVFIQLWSILGYLKYTYMSKHIKVFAFDQYLNHLNGGRGAPPLCLNCIYLMETLSIFDVWLLQTDFLSTAFIMQRFLHVWKRCFWTLHLRFWCMLLSMTPHTFRNWVELDKGSS